MAMKGVVEGVMAVAVMEAARVAVEAMAKVVAMAVGLSAVVMAAAKAATQVAKGAEDLEERGGRAAKVGGQTSP